MRSICLQESVLAQTFFSVPPVNALHQPIAEPLDTAHQHDQYGDHRHPHRRVKTLITVAKCQIAQTARPDGTSHPLGAAQRY